jgi:hypothetical protein
MCGPDEPFEPLDDASAGAVMPASTKPAANNTAAQQAIFRMVTSLLKRKQDMIRPIVPLPRLEQRFWSGGRKSTVGAKKRDLGSDISQLLTWQPFTDRLAK